MTSSKYKPYGFDKRNNPYIKLTPYSGGVADDEKKTYTALQEFTKDITDAMSGGTLAGLGDMANKRYYGTNLNTSGEIIIPITESFKKSQESTFETYDPASYFQGSFGGAGMMVGANMLHLNGVLGKFWSGSSIGIGAFQFNVAVDLNTSDTNTVPTALSWNHDYVKYIEKQCFPYRPAQELGVFRPPKFFQLWGGVGDTQFFQRLYVGIKRCDIETMGMWQSGGGFNDAGKILPTAYNITIEVEDLIVGREK